MDKSKRIEAKGEVLKHILSIMDGFSSNKIKPKKQEEPKIEVEIEKKEESDDDDKCEMLSKLKDMYSQIKE